ncbi:MAG: EF-hand domain-containing protein [Kangiellaceae bacterium]|jgi:Ca2+-binding EF-hand superfamily protein|nr:EF-hand domain-containing protein [Kangiellaceae bacterium]
MSNQPLTEESLANVRKNFDFFDRDGNGEIDLAEFTELLKVLSPNSTKAQAEKGFNYIDENGDEHIDFDEFLAWWETCWWEF